jgi:hypothetical protein
MRKAAFACVLICGLFAAGAFAGDPVLQSAYAIDDGGSPLVSAGCSMPFVVDWNNDGKKDMLVGESATLYGSAGIRLYLNQGTDTNPSFSGYTHLQAGGADIALGSGAS